EQFLSAANKSLAYMDEDVEIAPGRYLMEPMVFARLLQLAEIGENDLILDIGCATGYSSAVIARLADSVVALEEDENLASEATSLLTSLGVDNAAVVTGPLINGLAGEGPYDVIFLNGEIAKAPAELLDQLKDGGRLVAVISGQNIGRARVFVRSGDTFSDMSAFDASSPLLPGFEPADPGFVF
ncbi:MAG: protein-L-isoaspartate O-methyltransferase family protein, partial [Hyphomicrobiales bacterium]